MTETPDFELECLYCEHEFMGVEWVNGACPQCGNKYEFDEVCTEDLSDCWQEIEWEASTEYGVPDKKVRELILSAGFVVDKNQKRDATTRYHHPHRKGWVHYQWSKRLLSAGHQKGQHSEINLRTIKTDKLLAALNQ